MKNVRSKFSILSITLLMMIFSIAMLSGCSSSDATISNTELVTENGSVSVGGTLKNNTGESQGFTVLFDLYDASGEKKGFAVQSIKQVPAGGTYDFIAVGVPIVLESPLSVDLDDKQLLSEYYAVYNAAGNYFDNLGKSSFKNVDITKYELLQVIDDAELHELSEKVKSNL